MYSVYDVMYNGGAQCFSYQTSSSPLPRVVNVKLADYGISRFANPGGVKGEEGTPGYLAPEAIRRRGEDQAFDEKVCTHLHIKIPPHASSTCSYVHLTFIFTYAHIMHTLTHTLTCTHTVKFLIYQLNISIPLHICTHLHMQHVVHSDLTTPHVPLLIHPTHPYTHISHTLPHTFTHTHMSSSG